MPHSKESVAVYRRVVRKLKPHEVLASEEVVLLLACLRSIGSAEQQKVLEEKAEALEGLINALTAWAAPFMPYLGDLVDALEKGVELSFGETMLAKGWASLADYAGEKATEAAFAEQFPEFQGMFKGLDRASGGFTNGLHNFVRGLFGLEASRRPEVAQAEKVMRKNAELRVMRDATLMRHISGLKRAGLNDEQIVDLVKSLYTLRKTDWSSESEFTSLRRMMLGLTLRQMEKTLTNFKTKWAFNEYKAISKIDTSKEARQKIELFRKKFLETREKTWSAKDADVTRALAFETYFFKGKTELRHRLAEAKGFEAIKQWISSKMPVIDTVTANKSAMLTQVNIDATELGLAEIIAMRFAEDYGLLLHPWADERVAPVIKDMINAYTEFADQVAAEVEAAGAKMGGSDAFASELRVPGGLRADCHGWLCFGMGAYVRRRYDYTSQGGLSVTAKFWKMIQHLMEQDQLYIAKWRKDLPGTSKDKLKDRKEGWQALAKDLVAADQFKAAWKVKAPTEAS